jgi:hypothetical protein
VEKDNTDIRYRIIELLGYWAGLVNTTQLIQHFSISRTQAQKYRTSYKTTINKKINNTAMITSSPKNSFPIDYHGCPVNFAFIYTLLLALAATFALLSLLVVLYFQSQTFEDEISNINEKILVELKKISQNLKDNNNSR